MNFEVGDWVISTSWVEQDPCRIKKIELATSPDEEDFVFFGDNCCVELKYIQKWIPDEGEWCWFYKKNSKNAVFAKFKRLLDSNLGIYEAVGYTPNGTDRSDKEEYGYFYGCAPFIGEFPHES